MSLLCLFCYEVATSSRLLKFTGLFAKETHKRDYILHKRPAILKSLLIEATPYEKPSHIGLFCTQKKESHLSFLLQKPFANRALLQKQKESFSLFCNTNPSGL